MLMRKLSVLMLLVFCLCQTVLAQPFAIKISEREALRIGVKIWFNESAGTVRGLTSWNRGENFASMGIGHFIWYPADVHERYRETFPSLLRFIQSQGVSLPWWLAKDPGFANPWVNRDMFNAAINTPAMLGLRQFLVETIPLQAQFMAKRLEHALPSMLARVAPAERDYIRWQFERIAQTPQGVYALVDYVNFKGVGIDPNENYHNRGWGLLQVLDEMRDAPQQLSVLHQFAWAADQVLTRRVERAPAYLHEERWLVGWRRRLETYYSHA